MRTERAEPEIAIRSIQHYMYCPHRWGLTEIDKAWAENYFVTKANLMHERVHDPDNHYTSRGKKIYTAVPVYIDDDEYNLYGVTDCLEISDEGKVCIVEYKPTRPSSCDFREEDMMQVIAQKICVDNVFRCDCEAVIYYADVKKRVALPLKKNYQQYDARLKELLAEMRERLMRGEIPPIEKGQKCSGCSMKDMCMPKIRFSKGTKDKITEIVKAGD